MKYRIEYSQAAREHLLRLTARQSATVSHTVDKLLKNHPLAESKNCKKMRSNPLASWRLRIGDLRVFFDISDEEKCVYIEAVGIKIGEKVMIGGEINEL